MVTTDEMRRAASMGLRDVNYDLGPVITLVDGIDFENTWAERRVLMTSQIKGADLVALSRADLLREHRREDICGVLREYADNVIMLSVTDNLGLDCIIGFIE